MSAVASDPVRMQLETGRRKPVPLAFWLHSLMGLNVSLLLGFVCLTGTIATVSHEIEWLYKPYVRATTVSGKPDWGRMWEAARRAYPNATLSGIGPYDRNDGTYFAKSVSATDASGEDFKIYVDPGTSHVTGHEYGRSFQDAMRGLHYYLFAPGPIPMYVVTSLGFVILVSLVTGLVAYKKFWRGFFRMPRWKRGGRTLVGDLHRLAGLWSLWFVALIGVTSVWYFAEHAGVEWNTPPPRAGAAGARAVTGSDVRAWASLAQREMPGLAITAVQLPYETGDPVIVQGQWQAVLVRERTNAVFIDPLSGKVIGARIAHELGPKERIVHMADPLHFGTFGGLATKLIWFTFGLVLVGMSASGAYIYAKRMKLALNGNIGRLNYLGRLKWPSVALVLAVPAISFLFW